jgi:hypothetical protein
MGKEAGVTIVECVGRSMKRQAVLLLCLFMVAFVWVNVLLFRVGFGDGVVGGEPGDSAWVESGHGSRSSPSSCVPTKNCSSLLLDIDPKVMSPPWVGVWNKVKDWLERDLNVSVGETSLVGSTGPLYQCTESMVF